MPALTVSTTDHRGGLAGRSVSPFECRVQSVARVAPSAVIVLVIAHSVVDAGYRSRKCDPGRWHLQPRHSLPGGAVREGSRSPRCDHDSHRRPAHPAGLSFLQPMHDFGLCASFFAVLVACTMVGARIFFGMSNEGIPRGWLGHALPRIVLSSSALWWEESSELPCCECGSSKWRKAPVSVPIRRACRACRACRARRVRRAGASIGYWLCCSVTLRSRGQRDRPSLPKYGSKCKYPQGYT